MSRSSGPVAKRRRIGIFLHELAATGVARNAVLIANRLSLAGYEVTLLTTRPGGVLAGEVSAQVRRVALAAVRTRLPRPLELARTTTRLRQWLHEADPGILLSAGNHGHLVCWAALRGLPQIARVYRISNDLHEVPGAGRRGLGLGGRISAAQRRLIARDADRLAFVSAHLQDRWLPGEEAADKGAVIANGVAVDELRRRAAAPCPHPWFTGRIPVLVTLGRLARQKNLPVLIRALAEANRTRPVRLLVLGDGTAKARRELEALAEHLGVAHRLDLAGSVGDPFPYLGRAAAFVLPSLWEGSSNALLEAMACGAPVVASSTAGSAKEVLDGGRYGLLVEPDDVGGMAAAILRQVGDHPVRPGERARDFDLETSIERMLGLIEQMAEPSGRGRQPEAHGQPWGEVLEAELGLVQAGDGRH